MKTAAYELAVEELGGWPKGPWPPGRSWRRVHQGETNRKKNGYPFTTFTDLSDFLGIYAESLVSSTGKFTDILGKSSSSLVVPVVVVVLPDARGPLEVLVGSPPRCSGTIRGSRR